MRAGLLDDTKVKKNPERKKFKNPFPIGGETI